MFNQNQQPLQQNLGGLGQQRQVVHEGKVLIERGGAPMGAGMMQPGLMQTNIVETRAMQQPVFVQSQPTIIRETMPISTLNTVETHTQQFSQVPTVIRHDEQAVFHSNVSQATVLSHQEAPIVKTIVEQPIVRDSHREIIHEHHQNVINETHKDVIHEHHRPVIHEHIQPVIYQEHIHEKHVPIIHEQQKEIIHEKHVPMVHETHEKRVTEERRGAIVTESRAQPIITTEVARPIIQQEILETRNIGTLGLGQQQRHGDLIQEERIIEERRFDTGLTNLSSGGLGHTHVDTYQTDAYGVQKQGIGAKIKNAFKKATHRNRVEEDTEGVTYGPNGERIVEKHHYEEKY